MLGAFTIRMGTPVNEIKDKDLPSPSLRGIDPGKEDGGQQAQSLEKIKSRMSKNKVDKEKNLENEENNPKVTYNLTFNRKINKLKILPDLELNKVRDNFKLI